MDQASILYSQLPSFFLSTHSSNHSESIPPSLEISDSTDPSAIRSYTRNLLPFKSLFTWLNRDQPHLPTKNFVNREFAFTLQNDAYLRYNSFNNWEEFKKEVCRVDPLRFEIGPVYSAKVSLIRVIGDDGRIRKRSNEFGKRHRIRDLMGRPLTSLPINSLTLITLDLAKRQKDSQQDSVQASSS